ncbi:aspartate aminotransferase family protein [Acidisoma silvae]|uniref:Acetylornithine aminotransferase n=1 Tax=Acidisoma silvae TaxID=2802396 RepID=A0A963YP32_9PROT|nr:aspartate aminotransferase family protein [Acidisoma silvae]MCB8874192.1 aspartate aminotransferase family protein [Acidisoma silvae]
MISALMPNYNRADLAFERGEGAWLYSTDGRRFLDFGGGIASSSLGHGHPGLTRAIAEQAAKVMHVSNLYRVPQAEKLAARLVENSFGDSAFFCNSGAEANEGMVKMIRKYQAENGHPERWRIICFDGAFHGRTLAMISATGNPNYIKGFGPAVDGFDHVPFNNLNALRAAITPETAGIILEPIQGESGIRSANDDFLPGLRAACDEFGLLLGVDEIQTGMGRTGKMFAYEWSSVEPDVMSLAKGLGGGFPIGAVVARAAIAENMKPGTHGTTFGGNPLACAAGNAVLDVLLEPGFLAQVSARSALLRGELAKLSREFPDVVQDIRGRGLLIGIKLGVPNTAMQAACLAHGLMTVAAGDNVLRLVPPLTITEQDCHDAIRLLRLAVQDLAAPKVAAQPVDAAR